jgi:hypothetical protein
VQQVGLASSCCRTTGAKPEFGEQNIEESRDDLERTFFVGSAVRRSGLHLISSAATVITDLRVFRDRSDYSMGLLVAVDHGGKTLTWRFPSRRRWGEGSRNHLTVNFYAAVETCDWRSGATAAALSSLN